jgi:hypothetical protein
VGARVAVAVGGGVLVEVCEGVRLGGGVVGLGVSVSVAALRRRAAGVAVEMRGRVNDERVGASVREAVRVGIRVGVIVGVSVEVAGGLGVEVDVDVGGWPLRVNSRRFSIRCR